jgi:transposase
MSLWMEWFGVGEEVLGGADHREVARGREASGEGMSIPAASKKVGISDQTFYRWRERYGAMREDEAARLKALEQENARLKKIVAEQALDISMLKDLTRGNW